MTAEQQKEENKSMTVGQKIKYFRKRKGYTQKEVGELLGFSGISAISRLALPISTMPDLRLLKIRAL